MLSRGASFCHTQLCSSEGRPCASSSRASDKENMALLTRLFDGLEPQGSEEPPGLLYSGAGQSSSLFLMHMGFYQTTTSPEPFLDKVPILVGGRLGRASRVASNLAAMSSNWLVLPAVPGFRSVLPGSRSVL